MRRANGANGKNGRSRLDRTWTARLATLMALSSGCGSGGVTQGRLETAMASTFANLIQSQESLMGLKAVAPLALRASAVCKRLDTKAASLAHGGRDWVCTVSWLPPGRRSPATVTYEVAVSTDGCFTATVDGGESHVGGPSLATPRGDVFPNLLYRFEGCFDLV